MMRPVLAVRGTVALSVLLETKVHAEAVAPLKRTAEPVQALPEPANPDPLTWTTVPAAPEVGLKEVIVGAAATATTGIASGTAARPSATSKDFRLIALRSLREREARL
jgi:hypothetical protein